MTRVFGADHYFAVVEIRQCIGGVQPLDVRLLVDALFEHQCERAPEGTAVNLASDFHQSARANELDGDAVTAPSRGL
jgi:hypothetical protein